MLPTNLNKITHYFVIKIVYDCSNKKYYLNLPQLLRLFNTFAYFPKHFKFDHHE